MSVLQVVRPGIFQDVPRVQAAMSTRHGGMSAPPFGMSLSLNIGDDPAAVHENRRRFLASIGAGESTTAFAAQCHSSTVTPVVGPGLHPSCDALMTSHRGLALAVSIADCVPILLSDDRGTAIAAVHAGWRGSHQQIASIAVGRLQAEHGVRPDGVRAWIGPSAGPCCYAVGEDVSTLFEGAAVVRRGDRTTLDLAAENRRQLRAAGVPASSIEVDGRCTICGDELFHSYRRDRERSGRMLAAITISGGM